MQYKLILWWRIIPHIAAAQATLSAKYMGGTQSRSNCPIIKCGREIPISYKITNRLKNLALYNQKVAHNFNSVREKKWLRIVCRVTGGWQYSSLHPLDLDANKTAQRPLLASLHGALLGGCWADFLLIDYPCLGDECKHYPHFALFNIELQIPDTCNVSTAVNSELNVK